MIKCPKCSKANLLSSSFCNSCGQSLQRKTYIENIGSLDQNASNDLGQVYQESGHWSELRETMIFFCLLMANSVIFSLYLRTRSNHPSLELYFWIGFSIITGRHIFLHKDCLDGLLIFNFPKKKIVKELILYSIGTLIFLKAYFGLFSVFNVPMIRILDNVANSKWPLWTAFIMISVLPGIIEEVAFRGVMFGSLKKILSIKETLVIQAACFSVLHLMPSIIISHFAMGLLTGWIRFRTGHIYFCILIHMLWNASVLLPEYIAEAYII